MGGKRLSRFSPAFSAACASRPPQGRREQEGQQTPGRGGVVAELADQEFHPPGKLIHRWGLAGELTALRDLGDLEQVRAIPVPWLIDNGQRQNPDFLAQLAQVAKPDQKVVLLCRSGVRSVAAATAGAQAGFTNLWNIVGGFEGRLDEKRQRNHVEGWRFSGLPWEQS